jgi:hypothetical protein
MPQPGIRKANSANDGAEWWIADTVAALTPTNSPQYKIGDLALVKPSTAIAGDKGDTYMFVGVSGPVPTGWKLYIDAQGGAGIGTVTSVALTTPSFLTVAGSPITTSGTLAVTLASQAQNTVFASPASGAGAPTFRALVLADIPGVGDILNALNVSTVGTGVGLFKTKVGQDLIFKSLLPATGSGIELSVVGDDVVITKDIKTVVVSGTVYFEVVNPAGAPAGTYRVEASLV